MKYLIVESVAAKPHLETAGEIALDLLEGGQEVHFAFVGNGLTWTDCALPDWLKWFGCSYEKRVRQFERIIAARGISVTSPPGLPDEIIKGCRVFANGFSGDLSDLKRYRYGGAQLGMGVASSLISWAGDGEFDVLQNGEVVGCALFSAALTFEKVRVIIHNARPDVIITFNGRFATCRPIVEAALTEGVYLQRHERGATFDRYALFDESIHSAAYVRRRIVELWSQAEPRERESVAHSFFVRRRNGDGIGWYSFVDHQIQVNVPPRVEEVRRVVYFSSSDDEYAAISDTVEPGSWGEQLQAVQALIDTCAEFDDIELLIRVHPHIKKKASVARARWNSLTGKNVRIIPAESTVDSYGLLDSADAVVTYGSTIGIEAAYWGKPSVLLGPSTYAGLGTCLEPKSKAELAQLLTSSAGLSGQRRENCLPYGYYYLSYGNRYKYYEPESLSEGRFLGQRLDWDVFPFRVLRKIGVGRIYNTIIQGMR